RQQLLQHQLRSFELRRPMNSTLCPYTTLFRSLNEKMQISIANASAIREAEKRGIPFVVATGRGYTEAKPLLEEVELNCPIITLRSEEHTSELQSRENLVCRLLLEKKIKT